MISEQSGAEDRIKQAVIAAAREKPAYSELFPWLESLFLIQAEVKRSLRITLPTLTEQAVETRWKNGFPLFHRWEIPFDAEAAESVLIRLKPYLPAGSSQLSSACNALSESLLQHAGYEEDFWGSFLQVDLSPWEDWVAGEGLDLASLLFLARSCLRPAVEWVAETLVARFPVPADWLRGYCPVCGSLPSLLVVQGEGERRACCSWCGTQWGLRRFQCPVCDNDDHESLGYLYVETEPQTRIQYCEKCRHYFKLIDIRERLAPPFLLLEEWTTLHLDLLAQRAGWMQPPSPSPSVYRTGG